MNKEVYSAKIKKADKGFSLSDNNSYLDVWVDILLDEEVVAERRFAFPTETTQKEILNQIKAYCKMFENDKKSSEDAKERSQIEAEADKTLSGLEGQEIK